MNGIKQGYRVWIQYGYNALGMGLLTFPLWRVLIWGDDGAPPTDDPLGSFFLWAVAAFFGFLIVGFLLDVFFPNPLSVQETS